MDTCIYMYRITAAFPTSSSAEGKGTVSSLSRAPAGLCQKELAAKSDLAALSQSQSALCFQNGAKGSGPLS